VQGFALAREAIQAIEPDLLALEQLGAGARVHRRLGLERFRLARQISPALRVRGGALGGGLTGAIPQILEVGGQRCGPHRLGRPGHAVLLPRRVVGQACAQAGDLWSDVGGVLAARGRGGGERQPERAEREQWTKTGARVHHEAPSASSTRG
jgi:hypothetical protein